MKHVMNVACSAVLLVSGTAIAQEVYKSEVTGGLTPYHTEYAVAGNWQIECTKSRSNTFGKHRYCTLEETNGKKEWPGVMQTPGLGPVVHLSWSQTKGTSLRIRTTYRVKSYSHVLLKMGDQEVGKIYYGATDHAVWRDDDALKVITLFIQHNAVLYAYTDRGGDSQNGKTSLAGFTKAWQIAVKFVGYDPLNPEKSGA